MKEILDNIVKRIQKESGLSCTLLNWSPTQKNEYHLMIIVGVDNWDPQSLESMEKTLDNVFTREKRTGACHYEDGNFGSPGKMLVTVDIRDLIREDKLNTLLK